MKQPLTYPLTLTHQEILKAVLYFDVFNYPLTIEEIFENSAIRISYHAFLKELNHLLEAGFLKKKDDFILNISSSDTIIERRIKGNKGAEKILPTAYSYSKKIAAFPFVEGVCLSGGLSKKYYDEKGDIDFFIITKPGRLWICRTLIILKYKILPKHKKKYWCTNYFISSDSLDIPEKNAFTGTELAYLIPTVNFPVYEKILLQNSWYKARFPNKKIAVTDNCSPPHHTFLKRIIEQAFHGKVGDWIDSALLNITLKNWRSKYPTMSHEDFNLQFRSLKTSCKRHTHGFQNKVLVLWNKKIADFENDCQIRFFDKEPDLFLNHHDNHKNNF